MKILIITRAESDLTDIIKQSCDCVVLPPEKVTDVFGFDSVAVLGGTEDTPIMLSPYLRESLEEYADSGKPLFLEYVYSFRCVYSAQPTRISCDRLVAAKDFGSEIRENELLDSHYNLYIRPHFLMPDSEVLLYYRKYTPAHDRLRENSERNDPAMFKYGNILHTAFRICDWLKGSFAPKTRWNAVIDYIFRFLGIEPKAAYPENSLSVRGNIGDDFDSELDRSISDALGFLKSFLVTPDGKNGIREGLSHNIHPDGKRITASVVRTDCTGEAAGAFMLSGDSELMGIADNMLSLCYGPLTIHGGEFDGMVRWSEEAWNVCYQDDVARAILPTLLCSYFGINDKYLENALHALKFLCDTTAKDGLRPLRTDVLEYLGEDKSISSLSQTEHGYASAHYNAYYSGALLLGYLNCKDTRFKEYGVKGLETLMSLYPDTVREHSETSELCRLILPLSLLYLTTRNSRHREMLYRVFNDLYKYRHKSGGFAEWDSGYKAVCFNNAGGECSLLAENGDPVADLLYSLNWLPLGFALAYHATDDILFYNAWKDICEFFIKAQLLNESNEVKGAWCRGLDMERFEYFGIPHDVGWGPCCIETGWTVAEITMGMILGKRLFGQNRKSEREK